MNLPALHGEYYAECNAVFRRVTDQDDKMLAEIQGLVRQRRRLRLLSVGSGVGLFEIPMLREFEQAGVGISLFVGIDIDEHACEALERNLSEAFGNRLAREVVNLPFQSFVSAHKFDVILFNHAFEYLEGDLLRWIQKSQDLLDEEGQLIIFSPNRGGINKIYESVADSVFSDDIERLLSETGIEHLSKPIEAECDISLLENQSGDQIRLLSFLTQADCRGLPPTQQLDFIAYYLSLRPPDNTSIPHPATLFVVAK